MIVVSKEGETHLSDGTGVAYVGDLVVAIHNTDAAAIVGGQTIQLAGNVASAFLITPAAPAVVLDSVPAETLETVLSESQPTSALASILSQLNREEWRPADREDEEAHDHTHVPMSVIQGCVNCGVPLSEMAGFDTSGLNINLTALQETALSRFFPVADVVDIDDQDNTVSENAQIGDDVGIAISKAFADGHGDVIYTLTDDAGGLFAIDPETGVVTVAGNLDYEAATDYTIEVKGTSQDGQSTTQTFTVSITDSSPEEGDTDNAIAVITAIGGVQGEVSESISNGASTGLIVSAIDEDGDIVTYSLTDDANGAFTIDSVTGEVTVADSSVLDYETAQSHTIDVEAVSTDGSSSTQTFTISLTDDNTEFDVTAVTDSDASANTVIESAAIGTTVGLTLQATDGDGTDVISYSLSDDAGGLFAIDPVTGVVTVAAGLDYETATNHNITVVATSTDGTTSNQTYSITLTDDTSEFTASAVTDTNTAADTVMESASIGTSVGVVFHSEDGDGTDTITYSLTNDAGGLFTVNPTTGEVTVAGTLDHETATQHSITVVATSTDGSTSSKNVTLSVSDDTSEFAVTAIADADGSSSLVSENASIGAVVGITAHATDSDATDSVTYSLIDNAGGYFLINGTTGVVTVAGNLDYETATEHTIVVQARSSDGSTTTQSFTIDVANVDALTGDTDASVGAITDVDTDADQVSDVAAIGSTVGIDISAMDADGDNVTYSLSNSAGGLFAIDSTTGVVTVAGDLSALTDTAQTISVVATSTDGSTSIADFNVNVIDGGIGSLSDADNTQNISGDASNGQYVYLKAYAEDGDGDTVTYSLTDDHGGAFQINGSTGEVTVKDHTLLNASTEPQVNIEVTATSADGSYTSEQFTIDVTAETDNYGITNITDGNSGNNSVSESAANGSTVGLTATAGLEGNALTAPTSGVWWGGHMGNTISGIRAGYFEPGSVVNFYVGSSVVSTVVVGADRVAWGPEYTNVPDGSNVWGTVSYNGVTHDIGKGYHYQDGYNNWQIDINTSTETITYSLTDDYNGAFQINASTGVVTVKDASKLDYETDPNPTVTVKATSSGGAISSRTYGIALEDDYVAAADSYTATEENALTVDAASGLLANDSGDTNNAIEIASDTNGTNASTVSSATVFATTLGGVVTVNPDGSFTYIAPNLNHATSETLEDSFYYRVGDGSWVKVALDVTDQNITANNDTDSVGELGTIYGNVITDNGGADSGSSDVKVTSVLYDGTTYFVSGATTIVGVLGTLVISPDGSYSFASSATGGGTHADELFTYTLGDDDGDTDTAVLTVSHDSAMTAIAEVISVYESSLAYGADVGADLHYRVGNVLDNDLGITGDAAVTGVVWDSTNYTADADGIIQIHTENGEFSLYTQDYGVHRAGEYQFLLTSASSGSNETEVFSYTVENGSESVSATVSVSIVDDPIISFVGLDTDDTFTGTSDAETLVGGDGDDTLDGGLGDDLIVGGKGDDTLTGSGGADTFKLLHLDVEGESGVSVDHITDFDFASDVLDLSDLLQDESEGSLDDYLTVEEDSFGHAVINISSEGDGNVDQQIVFDNASVNDMAAAYSLNISGKSDSEVSHMVIESMLLQSHLYID
ncbi:cadherin domain-containing protein [Enterovibrio baiacu]|uniref:cadherin domain-containing protein n=1 Tax=Enterovibrio baiacu TaxID=2491023 RepID=UPI003D133288